QGARALLNKALELTKHCPNRGRCGGFAAQRQCSTDHRGIGVRLVRPQDRFSGQMWLEADPIASDAVHAIVSVARVRMAHVEADCYRAGSNNSIGFPSGSSIWICRPPGPVSMLFLKWRPALFSTSMNA